MTIQGYVAADSSILKTTDGGTTWATISSGTTASLKSVYFTDANTGYAVGEMVAPYGPDTQWVGIILKTIDGGANWFVSLLKENGHICDFRSVFFTNANIGYVVGKVYYGEYEGIILKTMDGGANWTTVERELTPVLSSVYFSDTNTGYAVGGGILKTTDGGTTWVDLNEPGGSSVYFTDVNTGYVADYDGVIRTTIDGGTTWTEFQLTDNELLSVFFADANRGYVVGVNGTILKTTNGEGTVSIHEPMFAESVFTLYPNPGTDKISIKSNSPLPGETRISVIRISGQLLMQARFQNQNKVELDVSTLSSGIYLVKIQSNAGIETKKQVIQ